MRISYEDVSKINVERVCCKSTLLYECQRKAVFNQDCTLFQYRCTATAMYCHIHFYNDSTKMLLNQPQIHTISHTAEPKWCITVVRLATYTDRVTERIRRTLRQIQKWGPYYRLCEGGLRLHFVHAYTTYIPASCWLHLVIQLEKYDVQGPSQWTAQQSRKVRCALI